MASPLPVKRERQQGILGSVFAPPIRRPGPVNLDSGTSQNTRRARSMNLSSTAGWRRLLETVGDDLRGHLDALATSGTFAACLTRDMSAR